MFQDDVLEECEEEEYGCMIEAIGMGSAGDRGRGCRGGEEMRENSAEDNYKQ